MNTNLLVIFFVRSSCENKGNEVKQEDTAYRSQNNNILGFAKLGELVEYSLEIYFIWYNKEVSTKC